MTLHHGETRVAERQMPWFSASQQAAYERGRAAAPAPDEYVLAVSHDPTDKYGPKWWPDSPALRKEI